MSQKELDSVERGEKALIVSGCVAHTPPTGIIFKNYDPVVCLTSWIATEGRKEGVVIDFPLESTSMVVVEPGPYSMNYFFASKSDGDYVNKYSSQFTDFATFYADGGDVIYIGDMNFNLRSSALIAKAISIHDNGAVAKKVLERRYSSKFSDKLRTRLIKLSPSAIQAKESNDSININFTN